MSSALPSSQPNLRAPDEPPTAAAEPAIEDGGSSRAAGRRVLEVEAEALLALAGTLDDRFDATVDLLAATRGRVAVTGMGKSGHIARKIAATLASTGTPALYVHPAEASHGDLGMIAPGDAVLALSNSGETPELADIVDHARRFGLPLVAITGRAGSTLAGAADLCLVLPARPEACPMGLAPTTSTTAMLALGDALAVALLQRRGFTAADFGRFHPGGRLGSRLVRVEQLMHRGADVPVVAPEVELIEAVLELTSKRLGCVGVVDGAGRLVGIITDGDLRRHMQARGRSGDALACAATEVMTASPKTIRASALATEAMAFMNASAITALFVVEDGRPVGVLHMHDCLRAGVV